MMLTLYLITMACPIYSSQDLGWNSALIIDSKYIVGYYNAWLEMMMMKMMMTRTKVDFWSLSYKTWVSAIYLMLRSSTQPTVSSKRRRVSDFDQHPYMQYTAFSDTRVPSSSDTKGITQTFPKVPVMDRRHHSALSKKSQKVTDPYRSEFLLEAFSLNTQISSNW